MSPATRGPAPPPATQRPAPTVALPLRETPRTGPAGYNAPSTSARASAGVGSSSRAQLDPGTSSSTPRVCHRNRNSAVSNESTTGSASASAPAAALPPRPPKQYSSESFGNPRADLDYHGYGGDAAADIPNPTLKAALREGFERLNTFNHYNNVNVEAFTWEHDELDCAFHMNFLTKAFKKYKYNTNYHVLEYRDGAADDDIKARKEMRTRLIPYDTDFDSNDLLIICLMGHGVVRGGKLCFETDDCKDKNGDLPATSINLNDMVGYTNGFDCDVLWILDCCWAAELMAVNSKSIICSARNVEEAKNSVSTSMTSEIAKLLDGALNSKAFYNTSQLVHYLVSRRTLLSTPVFREPTSRTKQNVKPSLTLVPMKEHQARAAAGRANPTRQIDQQLIRLPPEETALALIAVRETGGYNPLLAAQPSQWTAETAASIPTGLGLILYNEVRADMSFNAGSTMLYLSVSAGVWGLMPRHPAIRFIAWSFSAIDDPRICARPFAALRPAGINPTYSSAQ